MQKLVKKLHLHSGNIPCTRSYWRSTRMEFKATTFFNSYINNKEVSYFHTGSLAEFHEYHLRLILHNYVSSLNNVSDGDNINIIHDDNQFHCAVQKYKNVVTHYMASKFELWNAYVLKPIFGIYCGISTHEFAKTRGALHFHYISSADSEVVASGWWLE